MGQCLRKGPKVREAKDEVLPPRAKQDKNIDDKRMFKLGVDVLNRDFCIQIGYNRKAVKTYGAAKQHPEGYVETTPPEVEDVVS